MTTRRALLSVPALVLGLLLATASMALAAESPEAKIVLFDTSSPRDIVGVMLLSLGAVFTGAAVLNAVRQLAGKRSQADGKFRWR
jgi:uncharacterized membrane protein